MERKASGANTISLVWLRRREGVGVIGEKENQYW